jgi:beta-glucosidase
MGLNPNMEGEGDDDYSDSFSGDKRSIELPKVQKELYQKLKKLGKPIVFVNVSGSCLALGEQKQDCDAVIQCFYPGALGGQALADILFGECSPSGRLPVTFYASDDDLPDFEDYSMKNRTYKFFTGTPVFSFGEGLTYSDIVEEWTDDNTVKITNNGDYDTMYSVLQYEYIPHKSLKNFEKIFIKAGESKTVRF